VPPDTKSILLFHTDKYYLVNQVHPFGLDLVANALRTHGHMVEIACAFLADPDWRKNVGGAISRFRPDVIGMGIRNIDTCMSCEPYGDHETADYRTFYFLPEIKGACVLHRAKGTSCARGRRGWGLYGDTRGHSQVPGAELYGACAR
jgi:hypothetical protein